MRKAKRSKSIGSNVSFEHTLTNCNDHDNQNLIGLQSVLSSGCIDADEKNDDATSFATGGLAQTHFQVIFV